MGCDIHTRVEYIRTINAEQEWFDGDYYRRNPYYDRTDEYEKELEVVEVCNDRNYARFATLADVRNYGGTVPISQPRGIPKDCNEFIKRDYADWGCDAHSASYFTLRELIDYQQSNPITKYSGFISPKSAKNLDENGVIPDMWRQGTTDESWVKRSWSKKSEVLIPLIDELKQRCKELMWIYNDERIIEFADKIRIVFWFDN